MRRRQHADNSRGRRGARGEEAAAGYLQEQGYRIVARNWHTHGDVRGELDLVCARDGLLVFVEVKTRRSDRFGGPLAAVTRDKQARIRALAAAFLRQTGLRAPEIRFDVVAVWDRADRAAVDHLPGAF